jgi:hypothetical protein
MLSERRLLRVDADNQRPFGLLPEGDASGVAGHAAVEGRPFLTVPGKVFPDADAVDIAVGRSRRSERSAGGRPILARSDIRRIGMRGRLGENQTDEFAANAANPGRMAIPEGAFRLIRSTRSW